MKEEVGTFIRIGLFCFCCGITIGALTMLIQDKSNLRVLQAQVDSLKAIVKPDEQGMLWFKSKNNSNFKVGVNLDSFKLETGRPAIAIFPDTLKTKPMKRK